MMFYIFHDNDYLQSLFAMPSLFKKLPFIITKKISSHTKKFDSFETTPPVAWHNIIFFQHLFQERLFYEHAFQDKKQPLRVSAGNSLTSNPKNTSKFQTKNIKWPHPWGASSREFDHTHFRQLPGRDNPITS